MSRWSQGRFGSRKTPVEEVWHRVASELGGQVVMGPKKAERLEVPCGDWLIVTDIHVRSTGEGTTIFTRARALFGRVAPFRLSITKCNPFHSLGALVGYRPVPMRYSQLDRALFIRSDRGDLARAMLRGTGLGQQLMRKPVKLTIAKPERRIRKLAGDTVSEVQTLKNGQLREVADVRSMVEICMKTLDELKRLGVSSGAPEHPEAVLINP
jgi:hypothetical protein